MTKREIYNIRNELGKKLVKAQILLQQCYELSDSPTYKQMGKELKDLAMINHEMMNRMKSDVEKEIMNELD